MEIVMRKVSELTPYGRNAKKHDDKQIANVANSIRRFGWQQPIVVDEKGVVVIGHCRLLAAKKLKLKEVPVTVASGLTEDEVKELRIADNKTNESPWDLEMLDTELSDLDFAGFDFDFETASVSGEENQAVEDDFQATLPEEPKAKIGDIYQLGSDIIGKFDKVEAFSSVLDLFGGSGSTLIACEQMGKTCYIMELDPHYVDVIIDRWEQFTGQKAVLLNGR